MTRALSPTELRLFRRLVHANERALATIEILTRELHARQVELAHWKAAASRIAASEPARPLTALAAEMRVDRRQLSRFLRGRERVRPLEAARVREAITRWWSSRNAPPEHELAGLDHRGFAKAFVAAGFCNLKAKLQ